jgi:hypothetical protein
MSALASIPSVPANALAVFCLSLVLPIVGFRTAHAQCSQAARSEAASSTQSSDSAQNTPPHAIGGESSSTTGAVHAVRFVTGSAITVPEETPLQVMTNMPISSRTAKAGARFSLTVTRDVIVDDILVIPCGATVFGTVVEAKQAGRLVGASNLTLQLTALDLGGRRYALYTPHFKVVSASKTGSTVKKVSIGAAVGTLAADATVPGPRTVTVMDGSPVPHQEIERVTASQRAAGDALVGSVGAGIGVAVAASSPPSIAVIPAESEMEFTLASPIAVYPVDQSTAARLAQGMRRGGPVLYVRGESD